MSAPVKSTQLRSLIVFILSLTIYPAHANWQKQSRDIMGTRVSVEFWHTDDVKADQCMQQVFSNMHRIDELMSSYKAYSEISKINRMAASQPVHLSKEVFDLLIRANEFSRLSDGAFDITYASLGHDYDFRAKKKPTQAQIDKKLPVINYQNLVLKNQSVEFSKPGMRIDLGGIAKGHAVDQGIDILIRCGIKHALVTAGGDSRILGDKNGRPWMIGIQHPRKKSETALHIPLSNIAISTSGDYERYFLTNNERIHHIINPATGKSAKLSWSASVIGPDATTTDALSTTIFILGAERGLRLIDSLPEIDAIIIDSQGKVHYSSGLESPEING